MWVPFGNYTKDTYVGTGSCVYKRSSLKKPWGILARCENSFFKIARSAVKENSEIVKQYSFKLSILDNSE